MTALINKNLTNLLVTIERLPTNKKGSSDLNIKTQRCAQKVINSLRDMYESISPQSTAQLGDILPKYIKLQGRFNEIQKGGGFDRWFGTSLTKKVLQKAVDHFSVEYESTLAKLFKDEEEIKKLPFEFVQKALCAIKDPHTLFYLGRSLAENSPETFLAHIQFFKKYVGGRCIELGTFLPLDKLEIFCRTLQISQPEMEKIKVEADKKRKAYFSDRIFHDGICYGYSLALASQQKAVPNPETERRGRFVQAAIRLNYRTKEKNVVEIGNKILRSPQEYYPVIDLAVRFRGLSRGLSSREELLKLDEWGKIPGLIGSLVYKRLELIASLITTFEESLPIAQEKGTPKDASDLTQGIIDLKREQSSLVDLIENASPTPSLRRGGFSKALQRRQGFNIQDLKSENFWELRALETELKRHKSSNSKGQFVLILDGKFGQHAIYFSFIPAYFCDNNDLDYTTYQTRQGKGYSSADEMIQAFTKYINVTYRGTHEAFKITPIGKPKKIT